MGMGVGLVFAGGATTGGSDLIAALLKGRGISVASVIFICDVSVIIAGLPIFGAVKTMYSITAAYVCSQVVNLVLEGLSFARVVFIMSDMWDKVSEALLKELKRGATFLYGQGAYTGTPKNVIMIVVSKKQVSDVKRIVSGVDENAFVFVADVREVMGDFSRDHYM